jgi:hypothetical protein
MVIGVIIHLMLSIRNEPVSKPSNLQSCSNVIDQSDSYPQKPMDSESQHSVKYQFNMKCVIYPVIGSATGHGVFGHLM